MKGIKDLRGKRIAATGSGSQTEYETAKVLAAGGLTLDDIDLKSLGMPEIVAALQNGAVDGAILLTTEQLSVLMAGLDWSQVVPRPVKRPTKAC